MDFFQFAFYIFHLIVAILLLGYLFLRKRYSYWADRGIVHDPPKLFYGNLYEIRRTKVLREPFREFYEKYKNVASFGGFYFFLRRAVVLLDLDLVKHVLIKDFNNFAQRGNYYNEKHDPLSANLFNLDGPSWRAMRTKLTPTFTSGKMKFMFPTVVQVGEQFIAVLKELIKVDQSSSYSDTVVATENIDDGIEIKELLARFTTDVISSCAFGLECNSLKDPNAQFRLVGKKVFTERLHNGFIIHFMAAFPDIARKLGFTTTPPDISEFFLKVVRDTVAYRERENVQRNDFMNLLIELKNQNGTEGGLTIEQMAAQAFVFFLAGFETSSSTMGFCLYELARNQDIQNEARNEINAVLERYKGELTYDGLHELKYLKQILYETMRLHSIASLIRRNTVNDYKVPGTNHIIEKDTIVVIPIDAIHRDPDIYPNPEVFDPSRFESSEIEKRHPMTWLPFGEGPRNCIGQRFGEMQSLIGLVLLLKNFKIKCSKATKIPIEFDKKKFILSSKGGIFLKLEEISK